MRNRSTPIRELSVGNCTQRSMNLIKSHKSRGYTTSRTSKQGGLVHHFPAFPSWSLWIWACIKGRVAPTLRTKGTKHHPTRKGHSWIPTFGGRHSEAFSSRNIGKPRARFQYLSSFIIIRSSDSIMASSPTFVFHVASGALVWSFRERKRAVQVPFQRGLDKVFPGFSVTILRCSPHTNHDGKVGRWREEPASPWTTIWRFLKMGDPQNHRIPSLGNTNFDNTHLFDSQRSDSTSRRQVLASQAAHMLSCSPCTVPKCQVAHLQHPSSWYTIYHHLPVKGVNKPFY